MSASANLAQDNIAAFNSGDNFMLISNSEDNTKKFKNFQSKEIKRIKEISENLNETCDDSSKNNIIASNSNSNSLYQEVDSDNENTVIEKVEKKYKVGNVAEKKVNFQDSYQEIGAPLDAIDNEEVSIEDLSVDKAEAEITEEENIEVENTEVENTEVENTEVENTVNSDSEGLVVPNTVEEPSEEEIKLPTPAPVKLEQATVEKFVPVPLPASLFSLRNLGILLGVLAIAVGVFLVWKKYSSKGMEIKLNNIYGE